MKRLLLTISFFLYFSTSNADQLNWLDSNPSHTCLILENAYFTMQTRNNGEEWQSDIIRLYKGDIIPKHRHKETLNDFWYITTDGSPFKLGNFDQYDRVLWKDDIKKTEKKLMECTPYFSKSVKIEFETYNVFTQNDLSNGFDDNEKQIGFGILHYPNKKKCKNLKQFPVMFLIHHSGGDIVQTYKYALHNECVATFEPMIFQSRGHNENYYDTDRDIVWVTETQGAVDALVSLDVISNLPDINKDKIGIMGWSYGGIVALETQNMFNIKKVKPKNKFSLHLSYYPYCYHYEDNTTTDAIMAMFLGTKDYLPYTICQEYYDGLADKTNKFMYVYKNALHNFDGGPEVLSGATLVSPECRIHTDLKGNESIRPNDKEKWFDLTSNGGWFGSKGDPSLLKLSMELCWKYDRAFQGRNQLAFEDSFDKFTKYINILKND